MMVNLYVYIHFVHINEILRISIYYISSLFVFLSGHFIIKFIYTITYYKGRDITFDD